jgi:glycosyltransferase involved in cell wall biosynthesis
VVDDGSTDGTGDAAKDWFARYALFEWRVQWQEHAGVSAARRDAGLKPPRGEKKGGHAAGTVGLLNSIRSDYDWQRRIQLSLVVVWQWRTIFSRFATPYR